MAQRGAERTPRRRASAARTVAVLGTAALTTGLVYGLLLWYRTDYLGHYLAGFGGTLLLLVPLAARRAPSGWPVVVAVAAAIGLGYLTEATVFRIAIFDPVDFANQSLGACVAGTALVGRPGSVGSALVAAAAGAGALAMGFVYAFA